MLSGHLAETIMRVYDIRPTTAELIMDIAELVDRVAKMEYSIGRKDSAQPEQRWILCSERLPEKDDLYLVTHIDYENDYLIALGFYELVDNKWYDLEKSDEELEEIDVVAWMPLPEPYREGDKE